MKTISTAVLAALVAAMLSAGPTLAGARAPAAGQGVLGVKVSAAPFFKTTAGKLVAAVPVSEGPALGGALPAHVLITFDDDKMPDYLSPLLRQLRVYPADEFRSLDSYIGQEMDRLLGLVKDRPAEITGTAPLLPPLGAAQVFHAQDRYLDFVNGSGLRYISKYAQDVSPVTNQDVFYTFQGLTQDGQYYITFYYPISSTVLPASYENTDAAKDYDAFAKGFESYLTETVKSLNAAAPGDFTPNLDDLDKWVQSIEVTADVARSLAGKSYADVKIPTKVVKFMPTTKTLPTETRTGSCFANSISAARVDAWRCSTDNMIHDPCFSWKNRMVCDADPRYEGSGFLLKLTQRLPKANVPANVKADYAKSGWLFQLTDGTMCSPMNGATGEVDGKRINYGCEGGFVILGDLNTGKIWTADKVIVASEGEGKFSIQESHSVVIARLWQ